MARMSMTALPEYGTVINAVVLAGTLIYEFDRPGDYENRFDQGRRNQGEKLKVN